MTDRHNSNRQKLLRWLKAGAPHVTFNMQIIIMDAGSEEYQSETGDEEDHCGTACCLAGAAALMSRNQLDMAGVRSPTSGSRLSLTPTLPICPLSLYAWPNVRNAALRFLGLPNDGSWIGHELFDCRHHEKATPQQAAVALQNTIDGVSPCWKSL